MKAALVVCALAVSGCGLFAAVPPCVSRDALEKQYFDALVVGCSEYATFKECPDFASIKAQHDARMKEASCRY